LNIIEERVSQMPGILNVRFDGNDIIVKYDPDVTGIRTLISTIENV
jgi:hypothetical protein